MRVLLFFVTVLLFWLKTRSLVPAKAASYFPSNGEKAFNIFFAAPEARHELDIKGSIILFQLKHCGPQRYPPLKHHAAVYLALAILGTAWDIELNPGPRAYVYKGKYPCGVCAKACTGLRMYSLIVQPLEVLT